MLVQTTRFGQLEAQPEEILVFPQGLIGFESTRQWLIVPDPENDDVAWLQSIAQASVALPIVSPRKFAPDYKVSVPQRQLGQLSIRSSDRVYVMTVVSKTGKTLTVNLRSPIIINLSKKIAVQVITSEPLPLALQSASGQILRFASQLNKRAVSLRPLKTASHEPEAPRH